MIRAMRLWLRIARVIYPLRGTVRGREEPGSVDRQSETPMASGEELPNGFRPDDSTAPDRATTEQTTVRFTVKESRRGDPWVMIEQGAPGLTVLRPGDSFLGIKFARDVEIQEVEALARQLNKLRPIMAHTRFIT